MAGKIGIPSEETLALEAYISKKKDGDFVTYAEVRDLLGINLTSADGRSKFYTACKRCGREFVNKPGYGYKLSSANIATTIANGKVNRIESAAKRTVLAVNNLTDRHANEMTSPQMKVMEGIGIGCKTILGTQRNLKKIIRKELPQLSEVKPSV